MPQTFVLPRQVALDDDANPLSGALLYFFRTNTTTLQAIYSDAALTTQHSNPVVADSAGEFPKIYLDSSASSNYRVRLTTASGVQLYQEDDIDRFTVSRTEIGRALYPLSQEEIDSGLTDSDIVSVYIPHGNVLRYGADPTGVNDSSAAFRKACFSTHPSWVPTDQPWQVTVPGGKYKLLSTVYVRSGVSVFGAGMGTTIDASGFGASASNVFQLGYGLIDGTPTLDGGGYPPEVANLFFIGGPSGGGACIHNVFPGCLIHDIWTSAAGLGVYLAGGYLYDCEFDLGLIGVRVGAGTNQTIQNCRFFNPNTCIEFDCSSTDIADIIINCCTFEYPKVAAIVVPTGTAKVRGLMVTSCSFPNNAAYDTFSTLVSISNANCQVEFHGCSFHNWKNYAVSLAASAGELEFHGCVFDGAKTHTSYTNSTTAAGFSHSLGTLRIHNCTLRNLSGLGVLLAGGSNAVALEIDGLSYNVVLGATVISITNTNSSTRFYAANINGDGETPFVNNQSTVMLGSISGRGWFGDVDNASSRDFILVPYQQSSLYQITLTANQNAAGSGSYRKSTMLYVQKNNEFSGTFRSLLNTETAIEGAAGTNPVLDIDVEFASVGGGADIAMADSGSLAISWPDTYSFVSVDVQLIQSG